jgi:hypothetical protein
MSQKKFRYGLLPRTSVLSVRRFLLERHVFTLCGSGSIGVRQGTVNVGVILGGVGGIFMIYIMLEMILRKINIVNITIIIT